MLNGKSIHIFPASLPLQLVFQLWVFTSDLILSLMLPLDSILLPLDNSSVRSPLGTGHILRLVCVKLLLDGSQRHQHPRCRTVVVFENLDTHL